MWYRCSRHSAPFSNFLLWISNWINILTIGIGIKLNIFPKGITLYTLTRLVIGQSEWWSAWCNHRKVAYHGYPIFSTHWSRWALKLIFMHVKASNIVFWADKYYHTESSLKICSKARDLFIRRSSRNGYFHPESLRKRVWSCSQSAYCKSALN